MHNLKTEERNRVNYIGGLVALALSWPFSSGQTNSRPWDTIVGNLVAHALGDWIARASGPSDAAWGMRVQDPHPSKDHPWYEHCKCPFSSIRPSYKILRNHQSHDLRNIIPNLATKIKHQWSNKQLPKFWISDSISKTTKNWSFIWLYVRLSLDKLIKNRTRYEFVN